MKIQFKCFFLCEAFQDSPNQNPFLFFPRSFRSLFVSLARHFLYSACLFITSECIFLHCTIRCLRKITVSYSPLSTSLQSALPLIFSAQPPCLRFAWSIKESYRTQCLPWVMPQSFLRYTPHSAAWIPGFVPYPGFFLFLVRSYLLTLTADPFEILYWVSSLALGSNDFNSPCSLGWELLSQSTYLWGFNKYVHSGLQGDILPCLLPTNVLLLSGSHKELRS